MTKRPIIKYRRDLLKLVTKEFPGATLEDIGWLLGNENYFIRVVQGLRQPDSVFIERIASLTGKSVAEIREVI